MEVLGVESVLANLAAFNVTTQRKVKVACKAAADYACEVAKEICPVSPDGSHGNPPGTLRDGLEVRASVGGESGAFLSVVVSEAGGVSYELFDPVFYAGYVCLGTRYQAAQDFMTPALIAGGAKLYEGVAAAAL